MEEYFPLRRDLNHEEVKIGKSVYMFIRVMMGSSKEQSSRTTIYLSACKKRFVGSIKFCRTALPTQVDRSSRLRRSGEGCSRNSAIKLGVTFGRCLAPVTRGRSKRVFGDCLSKTQVPAKPKGNV